MDKNVQEMSTTELLEEFRSAVYRIGQTGGNHQSNTRRADLLEAEILRRMAW